MFEAAPNQLIFSRTATPCHGGGAIDLAPCHLALFSLAGLLATFISLTSFSADRSLFMAVFQFAVVLGSARMLRRLGLVGLAGGIEAVTLLVAYGICAALMSLMGFASGLPFADPWLARADAVFFGDGIWTWIMWLARASPTAMTLMSIVYDTLLLQPLLLVPILGIAGARDRLSVFLLAWMITLGLTLVIAPFAPAEAAYLHYGIPRQSMPGLQLFVAWDHLETLLAVRDGSLRHLSMTTLFGLATFPAFMRRGRCCWPGVSTVSGCCAGRSMR